MQHLNRRDFLRLAGASTVGFAVAACAPAEVPSSHSGQSIAAAPVTITLIESWFGVTQFRESIEPVLAAISEKMQSEGLNIEIMSLILEQHETKYTALYASGVDFTMAFDAPWYKMNSLREQGALLPIEELVETRGPKLKEAITEPIYDNNFVNGHLYGVPAAYYYRGTAGAIFREDLRKEYGVDLPTSEAGWPSFESFLAAVLENAPEMLPFVSLPGQSMVGMNRGVRAWAPGVIQTGVSIFDITQGYELQDEEDNPDLIANAELLRSWWEKGYVNKTDLPSSGIVNSQVDFVYPGRAAACVEAEPDFKWVDQTLQIKSSIPEADLFGVDMTGMRAGVNQGVGALKQWNFIVFNVNAPEEQHIAGIDFFNWLAGSQDNLDLWLMGIDGVNYKKEENMRFSEIKGIDAARNYRRNWYVSGMSGRYQRLPVDLPVEAEEAIQFFTTADNWIFNQYEGFEADTKGLEVDSAKLNAVYQEAAHGLMSGQLPVEEARAQMKRTLDEAGRQSYKEKLQKQLNDYIAAQGA